MKINVHSDQRSLNFHVGHCHVQLHVTAVDTNNQSYHYLYLH